MYCVYEGDPEVEICGEPQEVGENYQTTWIDDPLPDPWPPTDPGDPCSDPASGCYPGDGGGGYPQPEEAVDTPRLDKLMKNITTLTQAQKEKIEKLLEAMNQECIGKAIYDFLSNNNITFDFLINTSMSNQAAYNPGSDAITIRGPASTSVAAFEEELFHAYQNKNIPGGSGQYLGQSGSANIEFEAKVLRDLNQIINGIPGGNAATSQGYFDWLSISYIIRIY